MLSKLEFLNLKECKFIEAVFLEQNGQYGNNATITFPQLSKIKLKSLPRLEAFFEATDQVTIEFPQLYEMEIESCTMLKSFHTVKSIALPESDHNAKQQSFLDRKVMCSGLERLYFLCCKDCVNIFSYSMSRVMHNLKDLMMMDCEMLQEVVAKDEKEQINSKVILFPQLRELKLNYLPNMQQFCHMSQGVKLPSLEYLHIRSCGLMETFCRNEFYQTSSQASDSNFAVQPFFDEVTCSKLKKLDLRDIDRPTELFNRKTSIGNFSGLEIIIISDSQSLRSIFSPRMFRGLVNLRELDVSCCQELQEIISTDEEEGETDTVKETIFPQLKSLRLNELPELIRFCHIKNDLELPSLEMLEVAYCPVFEVFSPGSVHLPSLTLIKDDITDRWRRHSKSQFPHNKQTVFNTKILESTILLDTTLAPPGQKYSLEEHHGTP